MVTLHLTLLIGPRPIHKRHHIHNALDADAAADATAAADADARCAHTLSMHMHISKRHVSLVRDYPYPALAKRPG